MDVIQRVRPIIVELERQRRSVAVVSRTQENRVLPSSGYSVFWSTSASFLHGTDHLSMYCLIVGSVDLSLSGPALPVRVFYGHPHVRDPLLGVTHACGHRVNPRAIRL